MRGYLAGLHFVAFAVLLTQRLVELLGKVINGL